LAVIPIIPCSNRRKKQVAPSKVFGHPKVRSCQITGHATRSVSAATSSCTARSPAAEIVSDISPQLRSPVSIIFLSAIAPISRGPFIAPPGERCRTSAVYGTCDRPANGHLVDRRPACPVRPAAGRCCRRRGPRPSGFPFRARCRRRRAGRGSTAQRQLPMPGPGERGAATVLGLRRCLRMHPNERYGKSGCTPATGRQ
jgi:hypothetical protein